MKRAAITAVGGYVPDFVMTNEELAKFKAETAASLAIKNVPTPEVAVPYEQMSNFKKTKFMYHFL